MRSPRQPGRREARYPLHLPVSVKLAGREIDTQSENISLNGILLSSSFLMPEGSTVELAVAVGTMATSGALLTGRGKVLRVQRKQSGDFAVAIACERCFGLTRQGSSLSSATIQ